MGTVEIIGLSGTNGAGKDATGELLAERHGYLFISVTELLRDEVKKRGLPVEREHLRAVSAEWRRQYGLGVLVDRAIEAYRATDGAYQGVIMASLRNPAEADRIHELGGVMVWIDADPKLRYDRIQTNAASRGRSGEDNKTFEQFLEEERAEMYPQPGADSASLNNAAVKERSDKTIVNDTTTLDELDQLLIEVLDLK